MQQLGLAIDRAKEGVETPLYSYGKLMGSRRVAGYEPSRWPAGWR